MSLAGMIVFLVVLHPKRVQMATKIIAKIKPRLAKLQSKTSGCVLYAFISNKNVYKLLNSTLFNNQQNVVSAFNALAYAFEETEEGRT